MSTATCATLYSREVDFDGFGTYTLGTENDAAGHYAGTSATPASPDGDPSIIPKYARYRTFLDVDFSGVAAGRTLTDLTLNLYLGTAFANALTNLRVSGCSATGHAQATGAALYNIKDAAKLYAEQTGLIATGAVAISLGGTVLADAQPLLGSGTAFTLCLDTSTTAADSLLLAGQGDATSGHRPTLTATYSAGGTPIFKATEVLALSEAVGLSVAFLALESLRRF